MSWYLKIISWYLKYIYKRGYKLAVCSVKHCGTELLIWVTRILSATGRRNPALMFLQSTQCQSNIISTFHWCAIFGRVIPLPHLRYCHLSHPSHSNPSCRALTGSLHRMHRSCADMIDNGRNWNFDFSTVFFYSSGYQQWVSKCVYQMFSRILYASIKLFSMHLMVRRKNVFIFWCVFNRQ